MLEVFLPSTSIRDKTVDHTSIHLRIDVDIYPISSIEPTETTICHDQHWAGAIVREIPFRYFDDALVRH